MMLNQAKRNLSMKSLTMNERLYPLIRRNTHANDAAIASWISFKVAHFGAEGPSTPITEDFSFHCLRSSEIQKERCLHTRAEDI